MPAKIDQQTSRIQRLAVSTLSRVVASIEICRATGSLSADAGRLRQLLHNVLVNAMRYTDAGGDIEVRVHAEGPDVHIDVMDSPPGVPPELLPRLFDRFFRAAPPEVEGTGLGLAIVRHVMQRHGGELQIESVEGRGSTFTCHFPPLRRVHQEFAIE